MRNDVKTSASRPVMSKEGDTDCTYILRSAMRNGVKNKKRKCKEMQKKEK